MCWIGSHASCTVRPIWLSISLMNRRMWAAAFDGLLDRPPA
jgi:hypothetical protein